MLRHIPCSERKMLDDRSSNTRKGFTATRLVMVIKGVAKGKELAKRKHLPEF